MSGEAGGVEVRDVAELSEPDFADLAQRYRRELHVYCYRMLGSFDEAEDHVQEVFLRAWRSRGTFQGRSAVRTWLYRIATNTCLDTLRRDNRRAVPAPGTKAPSVATMPWLQPYPDALLDELAAEQPGPDALAVSRETTSLAFLAAIQVLPVRQRAVLILRDVLDWSASEASLLLDTTVPAVNSALQRARSTLRNRWPGGRMDWAPAAGPSADQVWLLQRYVDAHEQADPEALIAVLRQDVRLAISPQVGEWNGRSEVADALRDGMNTLGRWRFLPIKANGQPGADTCAAPVTSCFVRSASSCCTWTPAVFSTSRHSSSRQCSRHSDCQTAFEPGQPFQRSRTLKRLKPSTTRRWRPAASTSLGRLSQ